MGGRTTARLERISLSHCQSWTSGKQKILKKSRGAPPAPVMHTTAVADGQHVDNCKCAIVPSIADPLACGLNRHATTAGMRLWGWRLGLAQRGTLHLFWSKLSP